MSSLIFPKNSNQAKRLARAVSNGELKRIRRGIYTDADWDEIPLLLSNQWHAVVAYLYPCAIVSYSSAALLRPQNKVVHITADVKVRKKINISNLLIIEVHPGDCNRLTEPFIPTLRRSSPSRYLLENLQITHGDVAAPRALGRKWVEAELCKLLERRGEGEIRKLHSEARSYSHSVSLNREFCLLDTIIGALLSIRSATALVTPVAIALINKQPFDQDRVVLFEGLAAYLDQCSLPLINYSYSKANWRNLAFFESYFSNFIEGTRFEIEEAEQIVFEHEEIQNRPEDCHDVLLVFEVVHDYTEMAMVPDTTVELFQLLKQRHALIMRARPHNHPGELKLKPNRVGNTHFVEPDKIKGTLNQAFPFYQHLAPGIRKGVFMHFIIAECHPFDDGNGRLARIMMNAELVSAGQHKLIVPTVHQDSYLNGLRQASRSGRFRTITKVIADLQGYSSRIPWEDYGEARTTLESHCAEKLPDERIGLFNRQISQFKLALPAG